MFHVIQAALDGVSATRVIDRAFEQPNLSDRLTSAPVHLVAVGKAAPAMASAFMQRPDVRVASALAIGTHASADMPSALTFVPAGHPYPDARSRAAARQALARARETRPDEHLLLLVSGGGSGLMA
jgi:glycerate 2-kinase